MMSVQTDLKENSDSQFNRNKLLAIDDISEYEQSESSFSDSEAADSAEEEAKKAEFIAMN